MVHKYLSLYSTQTVPVTTDIYTYLENSNEYAQIPEKWRGILIATKKLCTLHKEIHLLDEDEIDWIHNEYSGYCVYRTFAPLSQEDYLNCTDSLWWNPTWLQNGCCPYLLDTRTTHFTLERCSLTHGRKNSQGKFDFIHPNHCYLYNFWYLHLHMEKIQAHINSGMSFFPTLSFFQIVMGSSHSDRLMEIINICNLKQFGHT